MSFEVLFAGGLTCIIIYIISMCYLGIRMDVKKVEINLLTILILLCPLVNTVFALYFLHKNSDYKQSIKKLFND